jgi:hypothetical protein
VAVRQAEGFALICIAPSHARVCKLDTVFKRFSKGGSSCAASEVFCCVRGQQAEKWRVVAAPLLCLPSFSGPRAVTNSCTAHFQPAAVPPRLCYLPQVGLLLDLYDHHLSFTTHFLSVLHYLA